AISCGPIARSPIWVAPRRADSDTAGGLSLDLAEGPFFVVRLGASVTETIAAIAPRRVWAQSAEGERGGASDGLTGWATPGRVSPGRGDRQGLDGCGLSRDPYGEGHRGGGEGSAGRPGQR